MKIKTRQNIYSALKILALAIVLHSAMILFNKIIKHPSAIHPNTLAYHMGDNLDWAKKGVNISNWTDDISSYKGIYWLRAEFDLSKAPPSIEKKILILAIQGSYEVYANGVFIGKNGKVGHSAKEEIAGFLDQKFILPENLSNQENLQIALRISNHQKQNLTKIPYLQYNNYHEYFKLKMQQAALLNTFSGIFLIASLYYFFLYFVSFRHLRYFLFAALCLSLFLLIVITFSRNHWSFKYPDYKTWYLMATWLKLLSAITLPAFLIENFQIPRKSLLTISCILLVTVSHFTFKDEELASSFISVFISTILTIWAIFKKRLGSWEALAGLFIFLLGAMTFDLSIFIGFAVLVIANLFSLAVVQKQDKRLYEASLLRSSRLELELLKKNIKPHFLMNTLTNIISLIESEPKISIHLIESLSEEFHLLNFMTDKKLVPLEHELKLCQSHLKVMRIRNDIDYKFDIQSDSSIIKIPPAVIHTLLENGITHCEPINGMVKFDLSVKKKNKEVTIKFISKGKIEGKSIKEKEGTGLYYIRSRLEESFPGKWNLNYYHLKDYGWQTIINYVL